MPITNNTDRAALAEIQKDLISVSNDRVDKKNISQDARLASAAQKLQTLQSSYSADSEVQGDLAHLLGNVQNLQGLAGDLNQDTAITSGSWDHEMDDVMSLAGSYSTVGDKSKYVSKVLGEEVTDRKAIGGQLADAPATSEFHRIETVPATFIEANNETKQYSIYDISGKMVKQFDFSNAGQFGIKTTDGQVMALSTQGYSKSWLRNGNGGREVVDAAKTGAAADVSSPVVTAEQLRTTQGAKKLQDLYSKGSETTQKTMLRQLGENTVFDANGAPDWTATASALSLKNMSFDTKTLEVGGADAKSAPNAGQILSDKELGTTLGVKKLQAYYEALPETDKKTFTNAFKAYGMYDEVGALSFASLAARLRKDNKGVDLKNIAPINSLSVAES